MGPDRRSARASGRYIAAVFLGAWAILAGRIAGAQSLDPLAIDPQHYHLEIENQWTRAFRELMAPHGTMTMHQHPPPGAVIVFLTDRNNRLTAPDRTARVLSNRAGDVIWADAARTAARI